MRPSYEIQSRLDLETQRLRDAVSEGDSVKIALYSGSVTALGWVLEKDVADF